MHEECTAFVMHSGGTPWVGQNVDAPSQGDSKGLLFVNKRGRRKTPLQLAGVPVPRWQAKYGSVSMTGWGRDYVLAGMNEAGLVVANAGMPQTALPPVGERPRLQVGQWNQYLLDTCASVGEVLAALSQVEPIGHFAHYLLADAAGRCLVIDFLEGQAECYTGRSLPWPIIVNGPYAEPLGQVYRYDGFGGQAPVPRDLGNTPRFARVARALNAADAAGTPPHERCFAILKDVSHEQWTKRTLVYDVAGRRIWFKSLLSGAVKQIRLADLDFSPETPTLMLDVHVDAEGDVTGAFVPFAQAANAAVADEFGRNLLTWQNGETTVPLLNIPLGELVRQIQAYIAKGE